MGIMGIIKVKIPNSRSRSKTKIIEMIFGRLIAHSIIIKVWTVNKVKIVLRKPIGP